MKKQNEFTDHCPECGELFNLRARCLQTESHCKNGHVWHRCFKHGCSVMGNVPKGSGLGCTCSNQELVIAVSASYGVDVSKYLEMTKHIRSNVTFLATDGPTSKKIDYVMAIGGDGAVLRAAETAIAIDVPLIGINEGHLGFMTFQMVNETLKSKEKKIFLSPTDTFMALIEILGKPNDLLRIEERSVLNCKGIKNRIVNELAILSGNPGTMVDVDIFADGELLSRYQGDGVIISTPSGSTAYNLSAGGPIVHPASNMIIVTPIASFSMSSRPIVLPGDVCLDIVPTGKTVLVADGRDKIYPEEGKKVFVSNGGRLKLIRPKNVSFVETCREKLKWQNHTKE